MSWVLFFTRPCTIRQKKTLDGIGVFLDDFRAADQVQQDLDQLSKAQKHGTCTTNQQAKCAEEYGDWLSYNCQSCPRASGNISNYTSFLLNIHKLQAAGCPIKQDDLTMSQWLDLYKIKTFINALSIAKLSPKSYAKYRKNRN